MHTSPPRPGCPRGGLSVHAANARVNRDRSNFKRRKTLQAKPVSDSLVAGIELYSANELVIPTSNDNEAQ
jgi:hypothetical protein